MLPPASRLHRTAAIDPFCTARTQAAKALPNTHCKRGGGREAGVHGRFSPRTATDPSAAADPSWAELQQPPRGSHSHRLPPWRPRASREPCGKEKQLSNQPRNNRHSGLRPFPAPGALARAGPAHLSDAGDGLVVGGAERRHHLRQEGEDEQWGRGRLSAPRRGRNAQGPRRGPRDAAPPPAPQDPAPAVPLPSSHRCAARTWPPPPQRPLYTPGFSSCRPSSRSQA